MRLYHGVITRIITWDTMACFLPICPDNRRMPFLWNTSVLGHTALFTFCIQCENLHWRVLAPQGLGLSTAWLAEAVQVQRLPCLLLSSSQRSPVSGVKSWQDLTDGDSKLFCPLGRCFPSQYSLTCRKPLLLCIDPVQMGNDYRMKEAGIANPTTPEDLGIYLVC